MMTKVFLMGIIFINTQSTEHLSLQGERNLNKPKETREHADSQNENIQGVVQAGANPGACEMLLKSVLPLPSPACLCVGTILHPQPSPTT